RAPDIEGRFAVEMTMSLRGIVALPCHLMVIGLVALGGCGSHGAGQMPGGDAGPEDGSSDDGAAGDSAPDGAEPEPGPWTMRGICSKDAWCWEHPLPQGNLLNDTWAAA